MRLVFVRILSVILDIILAFLVGSAVMFVCNGRAYMSSVTELVHFEIEDLELGEGLRVRVGMSQGGRGSITTEGGGVIRGVFEGATGNYDIVLGYGVRSGSRYSVVFSSGDSVVNYEAVGSDLHRLWDTVGRDIELVNGSEFSLQVQNHGEKGAELDFLTFVPSASAAYRPNGPERSYRWRYFFNAIDYDDMNVHLSFLKVIPAYFLISVVFLTFLSATPGMYLLGLRVVGPRSPSFGSAIRRASGNILTLGLGLLLAPWRSLGRTFADVLSLSQVLPVSRIKFGFGMAVDFDSVIKPFAPEVSVAQKLAAGLLDVLIIVAINALVLSALDRASSIDAQIIEIENFSVNRGWVDPSWRASGFAYAHWNSPWVGEFRHIYQGEQGIFDIMLHFSTYHSNSKYLEVEAGGKRSKFLFEEPSLLERTMLLLDAVELNRSDPIALRLAGDRWKLDYLELRPSREYGFLHMDYTKVVDRWLDSLGIGRDTLGFTSLLCLVLYPCYWTVLMGRFGLTIGSFIVGFGVRDLPSLLPLGFVRACLLFSEGLLRSVFNVMKLFGGWSVEKEKASERVEFYYL
jgi:hypothetical protein